MLEEAFQHWGQEQAQGAPSQKDRRGCGDYNDCWPRWGAAKVDRLSDASLENFETSSGLAGGRVSQASGAASYGHSQTASADWTQPRGLHEGLVQL